MFLRIICAAAKFRRWNPPQRRNNLSLFRIIGIHVFLSNNQRLGDLILFLFQSQKMPTCGFKCFCCNNARIYAPTAYHKARFTRCCCTQNVISFIARYPAENMDIFGTFP